MLVAKNSAIGRVLTIQCLRHMQCRLFVMNEPALGFSGLPGQWLPTANSRR